MLLRDSTSLSARRAWIEIKVVQIDKILNFVALRKESVDRNSCWLLARRSAGCRSPQGERG